MYFDRFRKKLLGMEFFPFINDVFIGLQIFINAPSPKPGPEGHQIITVADLGVDKQPFFVSIMEDKRPPKRQQNAA